MCSDLYFAELARWFNPSDSNLTEVHPNLERYYCVGSGAPLGFMLPG